MAGLFAGIRFPAGSLELKPTAGLVDVQPLEMAPAEEPFFGGVYEDNFLSELGADMVMEAPKPRAARKVQG
jgi:hypothetical protein